MRTRLTLILAVLGTLLFAASASASGRDANNDRIPDRWETQHGLSLKVKQARRDQDKDGFRNRAEWRAKTDPRDADTDGDGIKDSDENAGSVTAYENGELTITLFDGGTLTGKVTDETELKCDAPAETAAPARHSDDDGDGDDHGDRGLDDDHGDDDGDWGLDDDHGDDDGDRDPDDDHGDDDGHRDPDDDHGDDDGDRDDHGDDGDCDSRRCAADALKVGANVKEAELKVTSEGRIWEEIELR